jgi:hypothetical protein
VGPWGVAVSLGLCNRRWGKSETEVTAGVDLLYWGYFEENGTAFCYFNREY